MDFKTGTLVCFFALSIVHLALAHPATNESYTCVSGDECSSDVYAVYVIAGNETLCCHEGDSILFSAQTKNYLFASGGFIHYEGKNNTRSKRSVDGADVNVTIDYGCVCSPVNVEKYDIEGNFAVVMRYLRVQLDKSTQLVRNFVKTYVF